MRTIAYWMEDGYEGLSEVCSRCGSPKPVSGELTRINPKTIHFCYFCVYFSECCAYVDENETFPETTGGCKAFRAKREEKK